MSLAGTSSTASQVVLTVEHEDKQTHLTVLSKFTLADLMLLPATKFTTSTIWTAENQTFTGVELSELIKHLEIKGNVLHAIDLDEYYFDLPMTDALPGGPIVAYLNNGNRMTVREKGLCGLFILTMKIKNFRQKKSTHAASGRCGKS